ncbi:MULTISPECIES: DUF6889 family protein [Achromobacter]|nr:MULTISPECIES: hypothetical protein [Achromobacter]CUJ98316.1 Uncharacterised protein [Achromobacter sp. 2789STDY5608615]
MLRPVIKGMCQFESLKSGDIDLADIALMNDALDVMEENRAHARQMEET